MRTGIAQESAVFIVDGGEGTFGDEARFLRVAGFVVQVVPSPRVAAEGSLRCDCACVLSDLQARDFDPLRLPKALVEFGCTAPVVFLTSCMDVRGSVTAMKSGAMDVLSKPINQDELLDVIRAGMARDLAARLTHTLHNQTRQRFALLTPREYEVCRWVSAGLKNKQIASRMGIAEKTVKIHRGQAMRKLELRSVPELVRILDGFSREHADSRGSYQSPPLVDQRERWVQSMRPLEAVPPLQAF